MQAGHSPTDKSRVLGRILKLLLLFPLLAACSEALEGSSTLASATCSDRSAGQRPPPAVPNALPLADLGPMELPEWIRPVRKFDAQELPQMDRLFGLFRAVFFDRQEATVPPGQRFSVLIDHTCRLRTSSVLDTSLFSGLGQDLDWSRLRPEWRIRAHSFELEQSMGLRTLAHAIEQDPCVIAVSPEVLHTRFLTPNDTQYTSQTWTSPINAPTAWDTFYGSGGITGTTVVAVIDDGGDINHQDFSGRLWQNPGEIAGNSVDDDGNGYVDDVYGYNFTAGIGSPAQQAGSDHGTHVGGFIGARLGNSQGIAGIAGTHARLMFLNVFGPNPTATTTDIVNAINYARNKSAPVINMSLGGSGTSTTTQNAMINAVNAGSFIAVAAGNSSQEITSGAFVTPAGYAASISGAMSVASVVAQTRALSSFSNYSTTYVEIAAPGSDQALAGLLSTEPGDTYGYKQGTSMASPIVAGAAALAIGLSQSLGISRSPAEVETMFRTSSTVVSGLSSTVQGGRFLNLQTLAETAGGCR